MARTQKIVSPRTNGYESLVQRTVVALPSKSSKHAVLIAKAIVTRIPETVQRSADRWLRTRVLLVVRQDHIARQV